MQFIKVVILLANLFPASNEGLRHGTDGRDVAGDEHDDRRPPIRTSSGMYVVAREYAGTHTILC